MHSCIKFFSSLALLGTLAACDSTEVPSELGSLRPGAAMSLLCLGWDGVSSEFRTGHVLSDCPDTRAVSPDGTHLIGLGEEARRIIGLVTQPETGEVAVVDMYGAALITHSYRLRLPAVSDLERGIPGVNFLTVGAEAHDIVSTPGGTASVVGVRDPSKPGLYGIPTSCLGTRLDDEELRDITIWPACRLDSAPGKMALLLDTDAENVAATNAEEACPADVSEEVLPVGRRVLAVAMPEQGELLTFDVQELLNRAPGSFDACEPIGRIDLNGVQPPATPPAQAIPDDLGDEFAGCLPRPLPRAPEQAAYFSRPSDIAQFGSTLYVADLRAPVIHVLDVSDPAQPTALEPLLPTAAEEPTAVVTTEKVAVSPVTFGGKQYVYAVDASIYPGTIIPFEIGPGVSQRTPILRPRAPMNPDEPPDRIQLTREVADVDFARSDSPEVDLDTLVGVDGVACAPDPDADGTLGALYRPELDEGVNSGRLRGTFAFAAQYFGSVSVIDVEDLDAACRRPTTINASAEPNFRGCSGDAFSGQLVSDGEPTASTELSCNVVTPHRPRSAFPFVNDRDGRAVSLRQFPRLVSPTGRTLATDQSEQGRKNPKLLGVALTQESDGTAPELWVGGTLYVAEELGGAQPGLAVQTAEPLIYDPAQATRGNVTLLYDEPRGFVRDATFRAEYEGSLGVPRVGVLSVGEQSGQLELTNGSNAEFCQSGVQDRDATRVFGERYIPEGTPDREELLDTFARDYDDYLTIISDLEEDDSPYWATGDDPDVPAGAGSQCGMNIASDLPGLDTCKRFFGPTDLVPLLGTRSLWVAEAFDDKLVLEPREPLTDDQLRAYQNLVQCCFPGPVQYEVRGSKQWVVRSSGSVFRHNIRAASVCSADTTCGCTAEDDRRCIPDQNPLRSHLTGRTLEISCGAECPRADDGEPVIGEWETDELPLCVVNDPSSVARGEAAQACVYSGLVSKFAIYRGREPSQPGQAFSWQFAGGFAPAGVDLSTIGASFPSSATSIEYVPELEQFVVTDGGRKGVVFLPFSALDSAGIDPYTVTAQQRVDHLEP